MKLALHSLSCRLVMFVGGICLLDNGKHVQHRTTTLVWDCVLAADVIFVECLNDCVIGYHASFMPKS